MSITYRFSRHTIAHVWLSVSKYRHCGVHIKLVNVAIISWCLHETIPLLCFIISLPPVCKRCCFITPLHSVFKFNFQEWVKRLRISSICSETQIAPRHHDIKCVFFPFLHSRSLLHTQPASGRTSVTEAANQPRCSVPIKSRGGEFICGAACCHVENNSRRMEKGRGRSSLYSKLSQAAEKQKIHFIT